MQILCRSARGGDHGVEKSLEATRKGVRKDVWLIRWYDDSGKMQAKKVHGTADKAEEDCRRRGRTLTMGASAAEPSPSAMVATQQLRDTLPAPQRLSASTLIVCRVTPRRADGAVLFSRVPRGIPYAALKHSPDAQGGASRLPLAAGWSALSQMPSV